jgi:hypothetical protein
MRLNPLLLLLTLLTAACGGRQPGPARPADFVPVRDYSWECTVAEPQAEWAPDDYRVLARSFKGLAILREGAGNQSPYRSNDGTEIWEPVWINPSQFVYGPDPVPRRDDQGQVLDPNYGLRLGTVAGERLKSVVKLTDSGNRPRRWKQDRVVYSRAERILTANPAGKVEDLDVGFLPVPQPAGDGLAFQTVPIIHEDIWTGRQPPGELVVRWSKGQVQTVPGALEPSWTAWGGLVCTQLAGALPSEGPWWKAGTRLLHLPGPGKEPVVLGEGLRSAAASPVHGLVAAVDAEGQIVLVPLDGSQELRVLSAIGERPRWSHDGLRLLIQEPHATRTDAAVLRVHVLRIK